MKTLRKISAHRKVLLAGLVAGPLLFAVGCETSRQSGTNGWRSTETQGQANANNTTPFSHPVSDSAAMPAPAADSSQTVVQNDSSYNNQNPADGRFVGPAGPVGATGPRGERGDTGATGAAGVGTTGATGAAGRTGAVGDRGATGADGAPGAIQVGRVGPTGATGAAGAQGATGATGAQGASTVGATGATGRVGDQGATGPRGDTGARGPTTMGPTGPAGVSGSAGVSGTTGTAGDRGRTTQGMTGSAGQAGSTGAVGAAGADGDRGIAGFVDRWESYRAFWYESDMSAVSGPNRSQVTEIAAYLRQNPTLKIGIDGTSTRGANARTQELSARRVANVRQALIDAGVPAARVEVGNFGNPTLVDDQRVEILVRSIN